MARLERLREPSWARTTTRWRPARRPRALNVTEPRPAFRLRVKLLTSLQRPPPRRSTRKLTVAGSLTRKRTRSRPRGPAGTRLRDSDTRESTRRLHVEAGDQLGQAGLARLHVEHRLVVPVAGEALVRDDQPRAEEARARGRVEGHRRAVVPVSGGAREALELGAVGRHHGDLVGRPGERDVELARARDREAVRQSAGPLSHSCRIAPGRAVRLDRPSHRSCRWSGWARRALPSCPGAISSVRLSAPRAESGRAELARRRGGGPTARLGLTAAGRHAPDDGLEVVGHVQAAVRAPGGVVRHRVAILERLRAAAGRLERQAGRQVGEGRVLDEFAAGPVEQQRPRGRAVEQHEPAAARRWSPPGRRGPRQVLARHRPRAQQRAVAGSYSKHARARSCRRPGSCRCPRRRGRSGARRPCAGKPGARDAAPAPGCRSARAARRRSGAAREQGREQRERDRARRLTALEHLLRRPLARSGSRRPCSRSSSSRSRCRPSGRARTAGAAPGRRTAACRARRCRPDRRATTSRPASSVSKYSRGLRGLRAEVVGEVPQHLRAPLGLRRAC